LALDGGLMANVPEGASTGALGVSNLESLGRAFFDLIGVTRRLQREVLASCRYLVNRNLLDALPPFVADLSRCPASGGAKASRLLSLGPGTPLFNEMFALVLEFCRLRTNGDDDWVTSPLFSRVRGGRSRAAHFDRVSLLFPERLAQIAARPPRDRNLSMRVLNRWAIAKEHDELELPVRLNPEKGSEGPLARDYDMNSSRPIISIMTGAVSCYNKSLTYEEDFVAVTHPDRTMQVPEHSVLRLASLATLSPDPFTYSLLSLLFQSVVSLNGVDLDNIPLSLEQAEANGSLYQLKEANAVHAVVAPGGSDDTFRLRFPSYSSVLLLHGLTKESRVWNSRPLVFTSVQKVVTDENDSYLCEGRNTGLSHDGEEVFDVPVRWDLGGEMQSIGPPHRCHFTRQSGPVQFGH